MKRKAIFYLLFFVLASSAQAAETDLLVSEIMYDVSGADSGHEWLEFYNSGTESLTASSTWRFFDGSNHSLNLFYGSSSVAGNEFFILADNAENFLADYPNFSGTVFDTVMSLPNSSSNLALSFDSGLSYPVLVNYDSSWGGVDGLSLEKIELNQNNESDNWQESFVEGGTPGQVNSTSTVDIPPEENLSEEAWSQIIISEFLPNPEGSDDNEWIELYNSGPETVSLISFALQDNSARRFVLDQDTDLDLSVLANQYLVLYKEVTGISLNNSGGDAVKLYNPNNELQETVEYSDAIEGRSYARQENIFIWTKAPTPGQANQFVFNQAPTAQIIVEGGDFLPGEKISFSAESSSDPEGGDLDYWWNFGDGQTSSKKTIKHAFDNLGSYIIYLEVLDSEGASDRAEFNISIQQVEEVVEEKKEVEKETGPVEINLVVDDLIISEFIPNPIGSDDNEWIELYNASENSIDLSAWQLDDAEGGSKPYKFSTSTIAAKSFLVVPRQDSKIGLNNSSDAVRLLTPNDEVWQEVVYEKIPEGQSYAWDFENNEWFFSEQPSPGKENRILENNEPSLAAQQMYFVADVAELEKKQKILLQGVAINDTKFPTRSLYLADRSQEQIYYTNLVEVYSYYKDFPEIKSGQIVTVSGEISSVDDLPRVKIKSAEDVVLNDMKLELPQVEIIEVDDLDEDSLGGLVAVRGMVVKKSGKNIYLASEAEEEYSLRIYTTFSTSDLEIKKGSEVIASGILSDTDNGFKLEPFRIEDVWVSQEVLGEKIEDQIETTEISTSTNEVIVTSRKNSIRKILIFLLGASFIVGLVYFLKKKIKG